MGNVNNPSQAGFRGETVTSASYHQRPKESSLHFADHHGVVLNTSTGNSYLIHSTPEAGTVVTPASNMSKNWTKTHDIPVTGTKTVGEVFNAASGRTLNKVINYGTSQTCIGTAKNTEKALRR